MSNSILLLSIILSLTACRPRGQGADEPGGPTPVAEHSPGGTESPRAARAGGDVASPDRRSLPGRAREAPLIQVQEALTVDSLLGRRVRVSGHCTAAGAGPRAGSWILEDAGESIEVRGLVPSSCASNPSVDLTIFAQIEPAGSGSKDRLLLRLPD